MYMYQCFTCKCSNEHVPMFYMFKWICTNVFEIRLENVIFTSKSQLLGSFQQAEFSEIPGKSGEIAIDLNQRVWIF